MIGECATVLRYTYIACLVDGLGVSCLRMVLYILV